ncbi:MAG TPA: radical SAM protein [Dehalococcoidia bacterium]|nr:radical SAM protein [Dehalococcoidia bacterium]
MLSLSRLLCGTVTTGDALRYDRRSSELPPHLLHFSRDKRPVVVWNVTRRCNLRCVHCYASAADRDFPGELTTPEGLSVLDDLATFGVPVALFSGGEPLMRDDLFTLARYARGLGMRTVLSTNGTLLTPDIARDLKTQGFSYVGISLDGLPDVHDAFRGQAGAFDASLRGIRACHDAGVRVGLRFTITRRNQHQLPDILRLLEDEDIPRFCMYHLAYSGRGRQMASDDLAPDETRRALDLLCDRVLEWHRRGVEKEVLTVDNHADAAYLYLRIKREQPDRAAEVLRLLRWNGGNSSGTGVGCIDNTGNVHPDQFSWHMDLGNVRARPFSAIWQDVGNEALRDLRRRRDLISGRCSACGFFDICNGNLRVRAEMATGDRWASDPACYLSDAEIGSAAEATV